MLHWVARARMSLQMVEQLDLAGRTGEMVRTCVLHPVSVPKSDPSSFPAERRNGLLRKQRPCVREIVYAVTGPRFRHRLLQRAGAGQPVPGREHDVPPGTLAKLPAARGQQGAGKSLVSLVRSEHVRQGLDSR